MARREATKARTPRATTLLALVQQLQARSGISEAEVVATAVRLVNQGHVVLTGNFAGQSLAA